MARTLLGFKELFLVGFFLGIGLSGSLTPQSLLFGALLVPFIFIKSALFFALLTRFKLRARTALLGALAEFPRVVASAAELREPHRVARYLEELATAYHKFYDACRVLPRNDEVVEPIHIARLWLCAAARQTVANGLDMCGVVPPERM